ncbi:hypothetical protein [Phenylobacterium sp.]|uniref:hypothetical protein n=1 Tax=Phenylobacterium sp. TaxID=1871053 RepID=UPI002C9F3CE0|nr:hypothetical protein [Phenylobacterium sp.]HVI31608.1 hypothetical protein [Phenylobacterium sp.]
MADATSILNEIAGGLDGLANTVIQQSGDDRAYMEWTGVWHNPAGSRHDLHDIITRAKELAQKVASDGGEIGDADLQRISQIPSRIGFIASQVLAHLNGGNSFHAYFVVETLAESIHLILDKYVAPPFDVQALKDKKILPAPQLQQLRNIEAGIQQLGVESAELAKKVTSINEAHAIAEALPADIRTLEDARERYQHAKAELEKITENAQNAEAEIEAAKRRLIEADGEAQKIIKRANDAFSAATTIGLGKAFAERANGLNSSTIILAVLLVLALGAGGWITFLRVEYVHRLMEKPDIDFRVLWLNVTLTALSISAPVWAAWLITRQIGQRFRLAEDYGFKASVAKAYEGYRAQAAYIDPEAQKKLFSIALDRLAEAPLRLVEKDSPGSPVHEGGRGAMGWLFGGGGGPKQPPAEKVDA